MSDTETNDIETLQLKRTYQKLKHQYMVHKIIVEAMRKIEYKNVSSTDIDKHKIGKILKFVQIKDYIKSDHKDPQINALGKLNFQILIHYIVNICFSFALYRNHIQLQTIIIQRTYIYF